MPLVQLCVEDINRRLCAIDSVLPSTDSAQAELPLPAPVESISPPAVGQATSPEPLPPISEIDWSSVDAVIVGLELEGSRQPMRTLIEACQKLPKHVRNKGKSLPEILDSMTPTKLREAVNNCASWETCDKLLVACKRHRVRRAQQLPPAESA
jgi:hypothetical protein